MRHDWFLLALSLVLLQGAAQGSADTGPSSNALAPCPSSPNCVSSQSSEQARRVEPLVYQGSLSEAKTRLLDLLRSMKRTKIVNSEGNTIRAEVTSALLHFVDDVEFLLDDATKTVHVRSASRSGYYDFGVNRRRVEAIRAKFQAGP